MVQGERLRKYYSRLKLEEADIVLHFGWNPEVAEILRSRVRSNARIVVFEPAGPPREAGTADRRFAFVTGADVLTYFDEWRLGGAETDRCLWVESPGAGSAVSESLRARFQSHLRDRAANLLTHFQRGAGYFENVVRNFEYQNDADAGNLFDRFQGVPLVIVSAGPSLDNNIAELSGYEDRCFILSVDTALRPLLAAGVTPHAVVIADSSEINARHVAGAVPGDAWLIAEQSVHISALEAAQKRFVFGLGLFPDPLFEKYRFRKSCVQSWGSVATSALDLACRMGADPIIFAGQDFAYSWNREYAQNTIFHGAYFDVREKGTARDTDIYGNEAYTTDNLVAYRDFFVRRIRQSPGVRFINATEGGILRDGVELRSLRETLNEFALRPVDVAGRLNRCYRPSAAAAGALAHLEQALAERSARCACLGGFLELAAKQHVLNNDADGIARTIDWGIQCLQRRR